MIGKIKQIEPSQDTQVKVKRYLWELSRYLYSLFFSQAINNLLFRHFSPSPRSFVLSRAPLFILHLLPYEEHPKGQNSHHDEHSAAGIHNIAQREIIFA